VRLDHHQSAASASTSRPPRRRLTEHLRGTTVTVLIDDLDIRVLHRDTRQLIRKLTLDPTSDYQPAALSISPAPWPVT
jgi:hypothetical protein